MLEAMDCFVLGTVITEHALDVGHAANKPNVQHENRHANQTVYNIPRNG